MDILILLGKMQMKKLNNTGDKALYRMHLTGNYSVHQFLWRMKLIPTSEIISRITVNIVSNV